MHIGGYRINLDALLARIVYRWRVQTILIVLLGAALLGLGSGRIPPFWRGQASLIVGTAPGATLLVDGRAWPHNERQLTIPMYAGQHHVIALQEDGRSAWADITIRAGEVVTLTLPVGLAEPRKRAATSCAGSADRPDLVGGWRLARLQRPGATTHACARPGGHAADASADCTTDRRGQRAGNRAAADAGCVCGPG